MRETLRWVSLRSTHPTRALFDRLVGGEARPIGGDLEQDAVGLTEIQAPKIEAVDLAAVADTKFVQPPRPGMILRLVRGAERDVMHPARALPCFLQILAFDHMQFGRGTALAHGKHL